MANYNKSLQPKVTVGAIIAFVVLALAVAFIAIRAILPSFVEVERLSATKNLKRCVAALDMEIEYVEEFCSDWASWTATYKYVQDPSADYERTNLKYVLADYDMQLVCILNEEREVVWRKIISPEDSKAEVQLEGFDVDVFPANHPALQMQFKEDLREMFHSGVMLTDLGPMLIASYPILKSNGEGPIKGTFIMGRFLTREVMDSIESLVLGPFRFFPGSGSASLTAEQKGLAEKIVADGSVSFKQDGNSLQLFDVYPDLSGRAICLVNTDFPKDITQRLTGAMWGGVAITIISVFVVLMVLQFQLRRLVLEPIQDITRFVSDIQRAGLSGARLNMQRDDEIGLLANKMNDAVEALEQLRILRGLLPICAACKRIRDEQGGWNHIETYIDENSEAEFTHGICPQCASQYYPGVLDEDEKN